MWDYLLTNPCRITTSACIDHDYLAVSHSAARVPAASVLLIRATVHSDSRDPNFTLCRLVMNAETLSNNSEMRDTLFNGVLLSIEPSSNAYMTTRIFRIYLNFQECYFMNSCTVPPYKHRRIIVCP